MRFFVCLLDQRGQGLTDARRRRYEALPRSRGLQVQWSALPHGAVLTASDEPDGDPLVVRNGDWIVVGTARMDNRNELEQWSGCAGLQLSDLELVLRVVTQHGTKHIPGFLGDFGFVVWNGVTRTAIAACDILALKKLYYTERNGTVAFASRAEALALDGRYELQYLAELVANCSPSPALTVYADVHSIPAATMAIVERGKVAAMQYWRPEDVEPDAALSKSEPEAVEVFRELLIEAVRLRLFGNGETWAQLSGGLDSSSVVSVVQWLAERGSITHGLAGTVSDCDRITD